MDYKDLSLSDYRKILNFYKLSVPESSEKLRKKAEDVIAEKLCMCIKKIPGKTENKVESGAKALGICTKSVVNKKGFTRGSFSCKLPGRKITLKKSSSKSNAKSKSKSIAKPKSKLKSKSKSKSSPGSKTQKSK